MTDSPTPVPLWRRIAAMIYDSFLIFAIWIMVGFAVMAAFGVEPATTIEGDTVVYEPVVLEPLVENTLFAAMVLSAFLFFGWFWTHSGQTLGMQAWRIRVVNREGGSISWRQCLLRFGTAPFSLLLLGTGYWWALFDKEKRSWPDLVSGTRLIRTGA